MYCLKYILILINCFFLLQLSLCGSKTTPEYGQLFKEFVSALRNNEKMSPQSGLPEFVEREIDTSVVNRRLTTNFKGFLSDYGDEFELKFVDFDIKNRLYCKQCHLGAYSLLKFYRKYGSNGLDDFAVKVCTNFLYNNETCHGIVKLNMPIMEFILDERPEISATDICNKVAQKYCLRNTPYSDKFTVKYSPVTVNLSSHNFVLHDYIEQKPLEIIQLTDIHYDYQYTDGYTTKCNQPACCRVTQGYPSDQTDGAGHWGDYRNCDGPLNALDDTIQQIRTAHPNASMIYWTGDIVSHNVWSTTFEQIQDALDQLSFQLNRIFNGQVPIVPILGNHEPQPLNQFAPEELNDSEFNSTWLYEYSANVWSDWLPEQAVDSLRKNGYYSVNVSKNFKIIALNSNVCYNYNWWILYNSTELYQKQLQWFADELSDAEENGQFVHVLSHIPPGEDDTDVDWQRQYRRIITRFSNIIKATFVGHTHFDEFRLMFDDKSEKAINVAYNGGGVTAWTDVNPNYRVYYVDPVTYDIIDYEVWYYNLKDANERYDTNGTAPKWEKLYTFKEAYGIETIDATNLQDLVVNMYHNDTLFNQYRRFKSKNTDLFTKEQCNKKCKYNELCGIVTSVFKSTKECHNLFKGK